MAVPKWFQRFFMYDTDPTWLEVLFDVFLGVVGVLFVVLFYVLAVAAIQ